MYYTANTPPGADERELYVWSESDDPEGPMLGQGKFLRDFNLNTFQAMPPLVFWHTWHHGLGHQRFAWKETRWSDHPTHNFNLHGEQLKKINSTRQLFQNMLWFGQRLDQAAGIDTITHSPLTEEFNTHFVSDALQALLPPAMTTKGHKRRKS